MISLIALLLFVRNAGFVRFLVDINSRVNDEKAIFVVKYQIDALVLFLCCYVLFWIVEKLCFISLLWILFLSFKRWKSLENGYVSISVKVI